MITALLAAYLCIALGVHLLTGALAGARYLTRRGPERTGGDLPVISLIRPVCGVDTFDHETLASSFTQDYPHYEILFCAESESDPAVALVRALIADHPGAEARLLIGDEVISGNPKLNNVYKGYLQAKSDWLSITDSNLLLPPDYLRQLVSEWRADTGVVSTPAAGTRPGNLWGAVECAFLNTNQARWQLAADALGMGFAQGKTLFTRRSVIEAGGGLAELGRDLAEDVATTKLVRSQGLKVRLTRRLFAQPIGTRRPGQVWGRQLRWSRIRRDGFPAIFAIEILQGSFLPFAALAGLVALGAAPGWTLAALTLIWYGSELLLARIARWPGGRRDLLAMILRDAMLPAIWLATWTGRTISWRGREMAPDTVSATPVTGHAD